MFSGISRRQLHSIWNLPIIYPRMFLSPKLHFTASVKAGSSSCGVPAAKIILNVPSMALSISCRMNCPRSLSCGSSGHPFIGTRIGRSTTLTKPVSTIHGLNFRATAGSRPLAARPRARSSNHWAKGEARMYASEAESEPTSSRAESSNSSQPPGAIWSKILRITSFGSLKQVNMVRKCTKSKDSSNTQSSSMSSRTNTQLRGAVLGWIRLKSLPTTFAWGCCFANWTAQMPVPVPCPRPLVSA